MTNRRLVRVSLLALGGLLAMATQTATAEEFAIGVEVPLSGPLARVGTGMHEGITVAADVFNRKNGKHKIKLITVDDESSPAKAVAAVEKLASQGVIAIEYESTTGQELVDNVRKCIEFYDATAKELAE